MKKIACTKYRKKDCKEPCQWLVGKGCKTTKSPSKSQVKKSKSKSPVRKKTPCSKYRKKDCEEPCEWFVGEGCKNKKTPSRIPEEEIKTIQWDNNPDVQMGNLENCIQDIVINKYLGHGNYGMVYSIRYNNKNCALKIIPIDIKEKFLKKQVKPTIKKLVKKPLLHYTLKTKVDKEFSMMDILSKNGISPKVFETGTCEISLFFKNKEYIVSVGYMVSEQFDKTVRELLVLKLSEFSEHLAKHDLNTAKMIFTDSVKLFSKIDQQINNNLKTAASLGIHNFDTHPGNIMVKFSDSNSITNILGQIYPRMKARIIDWGLAQLYNTKERIDEYKPNEMTNIFVHEAYRDLARYGPEVENKYKNL